MCASRSALTDVAELLVGAAVQARAVAEHLLRPLLGEPGHALLLATGHRDDGECVGLRGGAKDAREHSRRAHACGGGSGGAGSARSA